MSAGPQSLLGPWSESSRGGSPLSRPENIVHHTMKTKISPAAKASTNNNHMRHLLQHIFKFSGASILALLAACTTAPVQSPSVPAPTEVQPLPPTPEGTAPGAAIWAPMLAWDAEQALPAAAQRALSRWQPAHWSELPGVDGDDVHGVWSAWMRSCERPLAATERLCAELPTLALASDAERIRWLVSQWQPYRVQALNGSDSGLLTGYFEPVLHATRLPDAQHQSPLHATPRGWRRGQQWFSRQQADRDPAAQAALAGRALVYLDDPIDALLLQIQGSGRVLVREPDGQLRTVRLAYAGHNGHSYQSVARWLLDRGEIRAGTWDAIRAWALQNPERVQDMLWANPRLVFFREEVLDDLHAQEGPRGAQGVPLTPMRSIAVDKRSIPYGTPVWLSTQGPALNTQRWVMAQDTGGAIQGAVRADFFTGWGDEAHDLAAALKQPLHMWVLWPRGVTPPN